MRQIPEGYRATLDVLVAYDMTVDFGTLGPVHPVYATYWMTRHMEEASRTMLLPFLEDGEDAVGRAVQVSHIAPALPGTRLTVTATYENTDQRRVIARCTVRSAAGNLIGTGETVQVVVGQRWFQERLALLRAEMPDASR